MTQVTAEMLTNAALDCDTIAAIATSTSETATDRLGGVKLTLTGALQRLGYEAPVLYATSLSMTTVTQTVEYSGAIYATKASELPFTTSGTFESTKFRLISASVPDGFITTDKLADGALSADATGLAKMADGFLSADAGGRAKMADRFVAAAKMLAINTAKLWGRTTASSGDIEEIGVDTTMSLASATLGQSAGSVINFASTSSSSAVSSAGTIPDDDSVPQSSEGAEYTQIATAITPKFATSLLVVTVTIPMITSSSSDVVGCIFRDSDVGAIAVSKIDVATVNIGTAMIVRAVVAAGSTTATTFKFRYGGVSGTTYIGGNGSSARYSTARLALMTIEEIRQ